MVFIETSIQRWLIHLHLLIVLVYPPVRLFHPPPLHVPSYDARRPHRLVSDHILGALKQGRHDVIKELLRDTWSHWPIRGVDALDAFSEAPDYLQHAQVKPVSRSDVLAVRIYL